MVAELLSVGTELLLGEIVDTNSAYLAQDLARRGVDVLWSQRVGDNLGRLTLALTQALARSDLVVMCGGLGPTDDDLSREAIAAVLGEAPAVDAGLEATLRARFASYRVNMPAKNLKQAWLIPSAVALPNALGTAPGWLVETRYDGKRKRVVALPGPPRELKKMWQDEAVPRLALPSAALYTKTFKTHSIGESAVAERLGALTDGANPSVATYAKRDGVHVRVAAKADTPEAARARAAEVEGRVRALLHDRFWGEDADELPALVLAQLGRAGASVAVMESLTGGLLSDFFVSVPGASAAFVGGAVAYQPSAKVALGVPEAVAAHASVSPEAALAMARAAAERFGAQVGVATTGVAGPEPLGGKPVGEVHVALFIGGVWGQDMERVKSFSYPPLERNWLRERAAFAALSLLWSALGELERAPAPTAT